MATLDLQVGASAHDAEESITQSPGTVNLNSTTIAIGFLGDNRHIGLYFGGVSGLGGTTIDTGATKLTFMAAATDSGAFTGDWYADDQESPPVFTATSNNISGRTPTTATCEGDGSDFGNWTNNTSYDFVGDGVNTIGDIIQELADSYDPTAIVLFHLWTSDFGERVADSYDQSTTDAAKLHIEYTAGGGGGFAFSQAVVIG